MKAVGFITPIPCTVKLPTGRRVPAGCHGVTTTGCFVVELAGGRRVVADHVDVSDGLRAMADPGVLVAS